MASSVLLPLILAAAAALSLPFSATARSVDYRLPSRRISARDSQDKDRLCASCSIGRHTPSSL